jgi:hypothetical protein
MFSSGEHNMLRNSILRMAMLSVLCAAPCQAAQQELVWSQSDGLRREIYHSTCKDGTWEDPVKITDDDANNLHPAFVITPDSRRWIFWSAVNADGISISYAVGKDGKWSEPVKMEMEDLSSAIAPSALADKKGAVWLVWAGNDGEGQDEIYWSRYEGTAWQKPKMINAANQVPDIKPEIALNKQGQIEVRWQGFRDGNYKKLLSAYTAGTWSPEQEVKEEENKVDEVKPVLPEFLPEGSQYVLLNVPTAGGEAQAK